MAQLKNLLVTQHTLGTSSMCYAFIEEELMRPHLDIYYDQGCPTCDHVLRIAQLVQEKMPDIIVTLIDLSESNSPRPDFIFAVPTYVLNDKTYSLGNPDEAILMDRLKAELDEIL